MPGKNLDPIALGKEWFQNNFPQKRATCLEKRTGSEVQCKTKVLGNS
jgi:hypothetical protein